MTSQEKTTIAVGLALAGSFLVWNIIKQERRYERSRYIKEEEERDEAGGNDTLPSIISHFQHTKIDYNSTITGANNKRASGYYQKARDAHLYDLCLGVRSYPRLRNKREVELKRIMHYYTEGKKSHRTIIVMCDNETATMLDNARKEILAPLNFSTDITTENVWIPEQNIIPNEDLHVTVAVPWWWHTIRGGNQGLTEEIVARFRQTLVSEFHHSFQIELERIVLLGGKTLVALWRCIGERKTEDGFVIYDRHGEEIDPFVKLRRDIVECFTSDTFGEPLTYNQRIWNGNATPVKHNELGYPVPPKPQRISFASEKRENSIELKTPGVGNGDGFIHTTLARLPLDCLSMRDVELDPVHRLCREATATYCGHRMVVKNFRFLETTGAGGESNPCVEPLLDETIDAPIRIEVDENGGIHENHDLHTAKNVERNATIGAIPSTAFRGTTEGLFDD
jgi:hypothetical protein